MRPKVYRKTQLRVLHLIGSDGLFGAEHVLLNLLPGLKALGLSVTLGCLSPQETPGGDIGKKLKKRGVPVIFIEERRKVSLGGLISIYRAVKSTRATLVHAHGYKATILGGLIAMVARLPIFLTYHGEAAYAPELSTYLSLENYFLRRATRVISVSDRIRAELIKRGVHHKNLSVIHNGIEDPLNQESGTSRNCRRTDLSPHLVCIGRLVKIKRYDLVIEALTALRHDFPKIGLSIAGNGPMSISLRQKVAEVGLGSSVRFLGYVEDKPKLYQSADIFVLPSESEGSPMTLIEAMAFSLPIVTTSVGAIPEMITNGTEALLIPPNNLPSLVESLRYLISSPQVGTSLGRAARDAFKERFNSGLMAKSYLNEYNTGPVKGIGAQGH